MRVGDDEVADGVILAGLHADDADAPAALRAVGAERQALDVAAGGEGDDDLLVGDHVFFREAFRLLVHDDRAAIVTVRLFKVDCVVLDQVVDLAGVGEEVLEVRDLLDQLLVLLLNLVALELGQAAELHVEHCLRLAVAQLERRAHQANLCLLGRRCASDRA